MRNQHHVGTKVSQRGFRAPAAREDAVLRQKVLAQEEACCETVGVHGAGRAQQAHCNAQHLALPSYFAQEIQAL